MTICEDEFADLDDTDTFGAVLTPDSVITEVEDWSDIDPDDEYSFALFQIIINGVECAYVFSGTRSGFYPDAPWDQSSFLWWIDKEPLDFATIPRLREIYDQLELPYGPGLDVYRFYLIENLERLLRITAESIGKRIDLICIDHINDIVDSVSSYGPEWYFKS